jgi:hypothetical protein
VIVTATQRYKRWEVRVTINGERYRAVGLPSRSISLDQLRSSCSVEVDDMPSTNVSGQPLIIDVACNSTWRRFFTGYVAPESMGVPSIARQVNGVDVLYKLNRVLGGDTGIIWNNVAWTTAISDILTAAGIGSSSRADTWNPGGTYNVGAAAEEIIEPRDTLQDVFSELLAFAGAAAYVLPSGKLRIVQADRRPASGANLRYSSDSPGASDYRIFSARKTIALFEELVSSVTASGPPIELGVAPEATYTIAGISGRNEGFSNRFIQTIPQAEAIAEREARARARLEKIIELEAPMDPDVVPGGSIAFKCRLIGYPNATPAYLVGARTSGTGMSLTLSLGPSLASGYSSILEPVVDFSFVLVKETLGGSDVIELFLDGSTSLSQNGADIVSWSWSTTGTLFTTSPAQASSSGTQTQPRWVFIYPATTTSVNITLTVSDGLKSASVTRTIVLAGDEITKPVSQTLSVAFGAAWYVSGDGGKTWQIETSNGDAIATPPVGAGVDLRSPPASAIAYGVLATRGSGGTGVRATKDLLVSASQNLASIGTAIGHLWQNEARPNRVWAIAGQKVYRSTDGGATFTEWGTPLAGTNPTWVQEDSVVENSVFVLVGNLLRHSTASVAPGTAWSTLFTGPTGATARTMVRARDGATTWIAFTGTFTGSPLQRVEAGVTAAFPVLVPAVSQIRAVAMEDDVTPRLFCWDDQGRCFVVDALAGAVTQQANGALAAGETAQHAVHDPLVPLVYLAVFGTTQGAVKKYLTDGDRLFTMKAGASGQQAHMIGLGGPARLVAIEILVTTKAESGAADKLWRYDPTTKTWIGITYPQSGWIWLSVTVNPFNPSEWLLLGNSVGAGAEIAMKNVSGVVKDKGSSASPLYHTLDAGATWTPVTLTGVTADPGINAAPRWSEHTAGTWYLAADAVGTLTPSYLWRGSGSSAGAVVTTSATRAWTFAVGGQDGDAVLFDFGGNREVGYVAAGSSSVVEPSGTSAATSDYTVDPDVWAASRLLVAPLSGGGLVVAADYRAVQPPKVITGINTGRKQGAIGADGSVYVYDILLGIQRITNPAGSHAITTVYDTGGIGACQIAIDHQTRTALAARQGDGSSSVNLFVSDGLVWAPLAGPPVAVAKFGDLAVIVRQGAQ